MTKYKERVRLKHRQGCRDAWLDYKDLIVTSACSVVTNRVIITSTQIPPPLKCCFPSLSSLCALPSSNPLYVHVPFSPLETKPSRRGEDIYRGYYFCRVECVPSPRSSIYSCSEPTHAVMLPGSSGLFDQASAKSSNLISVSRSQLP